MSELQQLLLGTVLEELEFVEEHLRRNRVDSSLTDERAADDDESEPAEGGEAGMVLPSMPVFDETEKSAGMAVCEGGTKIRSTTGGKQHVLITAGFSSGQASWELRIDDDIHGDECVCVGISLKPISSSSYDSECMWMYRAYSGELYNRGVPSGSFDKFHAGDVVSVHLDMDEGTISYAINGKAQGIACRQLTRRDLNGKEVYPCVITYQHSRSVTLLSFHGSHLSYNSTGSNARWRLPLRDLCGSVAPASQLRGHDSSTIDVEKELVQLQAAGADVRQLRGFFDLCDTDHDGAILLLYCRHTTAPLMLLPYCYYTAAIALLPDCCQTAAIALRPCCCCQTDPILRTAAATAAERLLLVQG